MTGPQLGHLTLSNRFCRVPAVVVSNADGTSNTKAFVIDEAVQLDVRQIGVTTEHIEATRLTAVHRVSGVLAVVR